MENTLKGYNLVLVSKVHKRQTPGGSYWPNIGEVFSYWENHTPNTLTARLNVLMAEHGVTRDEIDVVVL